MKKNKIENIKRVIKKTYMQYIGESIDGKATIADVAKFFNIPVDESRLNDYEIEEINYNNEISIKLVDKKNNTKYISIYTYNYREDKLKYIDVTAISPSKTIENVYNIGDNNPIVSKMTLNDGDYKLTFEKEMPNDMGIYYANANTLFNVVYSVDHYNENDDETCLLFKTFQKHDDGKNVYDFEQTQNNQHIAIREDSDIYNKHTFVESDNVMYGIDFFQNDLHNLVRGALFESTKISNITDHFPSSMDLYKPSSKFEDENTLSAIILMGYAGHDNYSELEVYKTNNGIEGYYKVKYFPTEKGEKLYESKSDFQLPNLDEGMITSQEIIYLLKNLHSHFYDDFIELISKDLLEFAKKIDIRKGISEEELDQLSPKLFIDKSFEEIENMIESNKDEYFKLASEQYSLVSHQNQEKSQEIVLKPNKSSEN